MSPSRAGGVPIRDVLSDPWELLRILNKLKLLLLDSLYYIPKWSRSVMSGLCDPVDCSLPGSSIHGIFQARILEWVAISFSRRSSRPRDWTQVSRIVGRCFTIWTTREVPKVEGITTKTSKKLCWELSTLRSPEATLGIFGKGP